MGYQKYTYHREFSLALSLWSNRLTRQRIKNKRRRNWYQVLTLLQGKLTNYSRYEQNPRDNDLALTGRHYWIKDELWTANYHLAGSLSRRDETNPVNWLAEHISPARGWSYDANFNYQAHFARPHFSLINIPFSLPFEKRSQTPTSSHCDLTLRLTHLHFPGFLVHLQTDFYANLTG